MDKYNKLASKELVDEIISNLKQRGIEAFFVDKGVDAKNKILEIIPRGSRVMVSTSRTLDSIGVSQEIEESGRYKSVRKEYMALDHEKDADKIRILRSTPDYIVGSVHAVTKSGEILIASNTGSQLAAYVSGAGKVIWVIGTQKIVEDLKDGEKRIFDYVLPLESERLFKLYGKPSNVSKLLRISKEVVPDRIKIIFVNEALGF